MKEEKRGPERPKCDSEIKKSTWLQVRLTDSDKKLLTDLARRKGLTLSECIRELLYETVSEIEVTKLLEKGGD